MQRLHRIHFDVLRQQTGTGLVTFHLPAGERRQETLRGLWDEVERQLTRSEKEGILAPLRYLVDDLPFWETSALSLSIFARENQHFVLGSPYGTRPRAVVGHQFLLAPILRILQEDQHIYVLELKPSRCRLYTGDLYHLREMSPPELPLKLAHALTREPYPNPELDAQLARFLRNKLVVVVGPPLLREATLTPSLQRLDVDDPPVLCSLHEQVWKRLRRHGDDQRRQALHRCSRRLTRGEEIWDAAAHGTIDTLAVAEATEQWGIWERGRWKPLDGPIREGEELINSVSLQVAALGGSVFVAPAQEIGPSNALVAGLRAGSQHAPLLRAG